MIDQTVDVLAYRVQRCICTRDHGTRVMALLGGDGIVVYTTTDEVGELLESVISSEELTLVPQIIDVSKILHYFEGLLEPTHVERCEGAMPS